MNQIRSKNKYALYVAYVRKNRRHTNVNKRRDFKVVPTESLMPDNK